MGYQEVLISSKKEEDFHILVEAVNKAKSEGFYETSLITPFSEITFKANINDYKEGTHCLYFGGERGCISDLKNIFGENVDLNINNIATITYIEDVPLELFKLIDFNNMLSENSLALFKSIELVQNKLNNDSKGIIVETHTNTWSVIDSKQYDDVTFFLVENDEYGDETENLVLTEDGKLECGDIFNGWNDFDDYYYDDSHQLLLHDKVISTVDLYKEMQDTDKVIENPEKFSFGWSCTNGCNHSKDVIEEEDEMEI